MRTILAALIGAACIPVFFILVMNTPLVRYIEPSPTSSRDVILNKADAFARRFSLNTSRFQRSINTGIDSKLLHYAQYYKKKNGDFPDLPVCYWRIIWRGKGTVQDDAQTSQWKLPEIRFDFKGRLTGFRIKTKDLKFEVTEQLHEDDALMTAKYLLESLNIDSEAVVIAQKDIMERNGVTTYKFTLKNKKNRYPHITDMYSFEIWGDQIVGFQMNLAVDMEAIGASKTDNEHMVVAIIAVIVWLSIFLVFTLLFVRKLRRDELEFKRALRIGLVAAVLMIIASLLLMKAVNILALVAASISGAAIFILLLIYLPVAESRARDAWPEKLKVLDLMFQSRGMVQETGTAVLRAFFVAGATLLLYGIALAAASWFDLGLLSVKAGMLGVFHSLPSAAALILKSIVLALFLWVGLLFFWPAYLKVKLQDKKRVLMLLTALTLVLSGLGRFFMLPGYSGLLLTLPIALLWAYAVCEFELLTVFLSLIGVNIFRDLTLVMLAPRNLFTLHGLAIITSGVLLLAFGVYLVFRPQSAKDYDSYVPDYVSRIAEKERFLRELEIARGVQMRFLPQQVPQFPSLEIVSLCQPAMEVGGDYYDFIRMDDRHMSVLIGDVSGKGVSAAFYMTMVKGIIKTLSRKTRKPAELLAEANEIFYENAPRDVFITIIYGIFDLQEKKLTFASAGHNPLIIWRKQTGKVEQINPRGIALGLDRGSRYQSLIQEECLDINAKDIFVFYTDGVTEAMNTKEEIFGEDRLQEVIRQHAHLSPQLLQEKILNAVSRFSGRAPQHDDFTMVVVKVR